MDYGLNYVQEKFELMPGLWFLLAALLPLLGVGLLLLFRFTAYVWSFTPRPGRAAGYFALAIACLAMIAALQGVREFAARGYEPGFAGNIDWLRLGPTKAERPGTILQVGFYVDRLTAALVPMVTIVSTLIILFSLGYMKDEAEAYTTDHELHCTRRGRFGQFFLYLLLFEFSMLWLLLGDNLLQIFIGWELVGASSYLLISFYSERKTATNAANKAFLVNRVGDAGFLVGIFMAWDAFGTLNVEQLGSYFGSISMPGREATWHTVMGLALFCGSVGKSAQIPLHTWLRDAMEGPTPVSALIHAATMVAAGVYLVARCYPLFNETTLLTIAYIGAATALLAAGFALRMTDIKRVLAYSTMSQLGFMMVALGVGGWSAGVFHLLTHAFFKALLFLGAGSVIHALHHKQDLRHMGGLRRRMPLTAGTMLLGVFAISGMPFFSGWASKDQILVAALGFSLAKPTHLLLFALPLLTAVLTAYYMLRLWLLTFAGESRSEAASQANETPWVMTLPLLVLAVPTVALGWGWPVWNPEAGILSHYLETSQLNSQVDFSAATKAGHDAHWFAGAAALAALLVGFTFAYRAFRKQELTRPATGRAAQWLEAEGRIDPLYDRIFTQPTRLAARQLAATDRQPPDAATRRFDWTTVDGWANLPADAIAGPARFLARIQTGNVRDYVFALVLTFAGLLMLIIFYRV